MPRPYPLEFRQRALDLVRSGRSVPEVAELLGIAESCLPVPLEEGGPG
jgi:transposase-like protein